MINYKVFNAGDALLSVFLNKNKITNIESKSIFDFGYSNVSLFNKVDSTEYIDAKTFLISHFHRDHFIGLTKIDDNSLSMDMLVIPKLPFNEVMSIGIKSFVAIQLFYLAEETGFYETDVLNIIKRKNKNNFKVNRKCINDSFIASNIEFDVIWPDPNYLSNIKSINKALNDILIILKENEDFSIFYNEVLESRFLNESIDIIADDESNVLKPFEIILTNEQRLSLRKINSTLLRLANDICLAFENTENGFLSLGDLSNRALWNLFDTKFHTPVKYEIILSAHHGTHYTNHSNWKNINSCFVVHSNGIKMNGFYRNEYSTFSAQHHKTFINGHLESWPIVRNCRLSKIIE